ncbi:hypothetical protein LEP1GSC193_2783 [Leptospira alstonii serovar Pingchang str. 80-412]|uniref:Uncharacterized protein n=1 Tax=Leptospira alstonii serovar Pingchang str. 80-412 TaxID=1218564 RepID=T0H989_9LEPT|nr:hypothetical protein LEP1GSC193_2783 [Leptospira alstonii serovar Pingchang str. 80-412]
MESLNLFSSFSPFIFLFAFLVKTKPFTVYDILMNTNDSPLILNIYELYLNSDSYFFKIRIIY